MVKFSSYRGRQLLFLKLPFLLGYSREFTSWLSQGVLLGYPNNTIAITALV